MASRLFRDAILFWDWYLRLFGMESSFEEAIPPRRKEFTTIFNNPGVTPQIFGTPSQ
ncbi:MAG: hypothetical protein KKG99_15125 [Bacteroidetes bacterium]|nr:hypothetical protein [Bacteroidota bacterium]